MPDANVTTKELLNELSWRGLIHQTTDEAALREHLSASRKLYCGFDPTADSLTIGNLVPIMLLKHAQLAGHTPYVLAGGGTGLIGDPSGKSAERQLQTREQVEANVAAQSRIFERVLEFDGPGGAVLVNNADWLTELSFIDVLRDVGKHFSVNAMIERESVKTRLTTREQGISYTEFSYMILQAYDFLHLYREHGVTVQAGGSDQWGNIVAGTDLIRKSEMALSADRGRELERTIKKLPGGSVVWHSVDVRAEELARELRAGGAGVLRERAERWRSSIQAIVAQESHAVWDEHDVAVWQGFLRASSPTETFAITAPLVTKADGGKFGKTETGAIWLSAERTSPYAYYQFWLNAADADVGKFLRIFTLLSRDEIEALDAAHAENPGKREAHRALARAATSILHGESAMEEAEAAGKALFSGDLASLPESLLNEVLAAVPSSAHSKDALPQTDLADLLIATDLAKSKREAREFLQNGSVSVNGRKIGPDASLSSSDLLHGSVLAIRRGKKAWHVTRWS